MLFSIGRTLYAVVLLIGGVLPLAAQAPAEMQVILLGTGYPRPDTERAGGANAVVVGEKVFVVDTGRGVTIRLWATGLPLKNVRAVFLTHLHSDHTSGLPDLFTSTWVYGRSTPLELYGPDGIKGMAEGLLKFFAADIHIRRDLTEMLPAAGGRINTHTVKEGLVYEDPDVRIIAFRVDHRPVVPAFGFRFESKDAEGGVTKTIVISGDTHPNENLVQHARGVDVLVHEVCLPEFFDQSDTPEVAAILKRYHTSADEVGQVAAAAGVKLLVLTHVIPGDTASESTFLERAGKNFKGKIVVGHDLMRF